MHEIFLPLNNTEGEFKYIIGAYTILAMDPAVGCNFYTY